MIVNPGSTDVTTYFVLRTAATGVELTGATITNIDLQYTRSGVAPTAKVDATALAATDSAHSDNTAIEIDATDQPGLYRVDWPDLAFAAGVREVILTVKYATAFTEHLRVELAPSVNAVQISGDSTAADNAEAFFDGTGYAGTNNVIPLVTTTTTATTATNVTTVNGLAAGVITEAAFANNAITDAKVASDVTIASVTGAVGSVTGAVGSVTGAVGSVTGNVGGNVTGSVGSVVGAVGSVTAGVNVTQIEGADATDTLATLDDAVLAAIAALNNLSSAQAQTAAAAALTAYDPPTNAEMEARTLPTASYALASALSSLAAKFTGMTSLTEWLGALAGKQTANTTARTEIRATGAGSGTYNETTDSLEGSVDGGAGGGATAAQVWSYNNRTLSTSGATVPTPLTGDVLTLRRDTTNVITIEAVGTIADRDKLWFALKTDPRHDDDRAVILLEETDGLTVIEGDEPEAGIEATLVVDDEDAGDVTVTIPADTSALLAIEPRTGLVGELKVLRDDGTVESLTTYKARIQPAVVRAIE